MIYLHALALVVTMGVESLWCHNNTPRQVQAFQGACNVCASRHTTGIRTEEGLACLPFESRQEAPMATTAESVYTDKQLAYLERIKQLALDFSHISYDINDEGLEEPTYSYAMESIERRFLEAAELLKGVEA